MQHSLLTPVQPEDRLSDLNQYIELTYYTFFPGCITDSFEVHPRKMHLYPSYTA